MKIILAILFFLLPLVWCRYLNANYLSTKTFLLYFVSALALLAMPSRMNLHKVPAPLLWLLAAVFVYYVGFHFITPGFLNTLYLFKMLSFAVLTLYFFSLNLKTETLFRRLNIPFFLMWAGILIVTTIEVFTLRVLNDNVKTDAILSTFGNINMFSEFAALSVPLLVAWGRYLEPGKWRIPGWLKTVFLTLVVFLVLYGRSRSALMGLILWFAFKAWQGLQKREFAALISAVLLFTISHFTNPTPDAISKFAPKSFAERGSLYKASFDLLMDRPLGSEPGQFVNDIVPYLIPQRQGPNEFAYFDQPHSEFLKWGIQFGWPMLLLSLAVFGYLFYEMLRRYRATEPAKRDHSSLFLETLLILAPELCFQFPFENPATILLLAFIFGVYLSSYPRGISLRMRIVQPFFGVLALAALLNSFLFLSAISLESLFPRSTDLMDVACKVYPVNFRTCHWKNKNLLDYGNIAAFRTQFKEDYLKNPFFCDNLRLLPEYFNRQQNGRKTCEALLLYGVIYPKQTHFTPETMQLCRNYSLPFKYENGAQFDRDFRRWFTSY
jgi:hypothetical protein